MEREMAIEELQRHRQEFAHDHGWSGSVLDALDAAIKALQTEQLKESPEIFNKDSATESMLNVDLISRQAVLDLFENHANGSFAYGIVWSKIKELPSVQPEQKMGHWEYMQYDGNPNIGNWHCSECGRIVFLLKSQKSGETPLYDYCPWCGTKMEEGGTE